MIDWMIDWLMSVNNVYMFVEGQETDLKKESRKGNL